jgi:hypothetical protein
MNALEYGNEFSVFAFPNLFFFFGSQRLKLPSGSGLPGSGWCADDRTQIHLSRVPFYFLRRVKY